MTPKALGLLLMALTGCDSDGVSYRDAGDYCAAQGSEIGIRQCQQFYSHNRFDPVPPQIVHEASGYRDPGPGYWLGLTNMGLGMATYRPPAPTTTTCSNFGMRGQGFSCTSQ